MACVRVVVVVCVVLVTLVGRCCEGKLLLPSPRLVDPLQKSGNISNVKAKLPRLGSTLRTSATRGGQRLSTEDAQQVSSLSAVQDCDQTFALDDGEAALLYSRNDLYRYTCRQVFTTVNLDSHLEFTCHTLSLKFNCFLEALKVKVDGEEEVYCSNDVVASRQGKVVEVEYERKIGGINGIYVCTVTAELVLATKLQEAPCTECGVTSAMEQGTRLGEEPSVLRVVGGRDAGEKEYPWMAFLIMQAGDDRFSCGGTLVTSTIVLSAAHCFHGYDVETVEVGLGKVYRDVVGDSPWHWYFTHNFEVHPEYDQHNIQNDAAIIILNSPVSFTDYIRPACLPAADPNLDGATLIATGWGTLSYEGKAATTLQEVELTVWKNADCQNVWRGLLDDQRFTLLTSQLCASRPGKDTCNGDSGGPLLLKSDGRWTVVGITSYGYLCAVEGKPGVYTRVSKYLPWINSFIPEDSCVTE